MPCFHPIKGYYSSYVNPQTGKRPVVFITHNALIDRPVSVPCGRCVGCRLERSKQWAIRCYHESQLHDRNCFITLTYNDDSLDAIGSLRPRDYVLFMKRLRKRFGEGIRFFHCGEYGEQLLRPHHHACLFNFDFPDKKFWKAQNGQRYYRSAILEELWPYGYSSIGQVTFESAAYVARYIMKKVNGDMADEHYYNRDTGECLVPEYVTMSRRPGIAYDWFKKYGDDVYSNDSVRMRGDLLLKPPRYYDKLFDLQSPKEFAKIKTARIVRATSLDNDNNSPERLLIREKVANARLGQLKRSL